MPSMASARSPPDLNKIKPRKFVEQIRPPPVIALQRALTIRHTRALKLISDT